MSCQNDSLERPTDYHQINQRDSSPHYVLLYSDDEHSGDEEYIPLQNRNQSESSSPRKVKIVKIPLQPDDTLQSLALKYRCKVSELKRINNIDKDNEIFAHRTIKVPVLPHSILAEMLPKIQDESSTSSKEETEKMSTSKEEQILNLITNPIVVSFPKSDINNIILNSMLEPVTPEESHEIIEEAEDVQLLSNSERDIVQKSSSSESFRCSGADWGLSWLQLLGVSLLLGLAGPIIYILYIVDASNHHLESEHPLLKSTKLNSS